MHCSLEATKAETDEAKVRSLHKAPLTEMRIKKRNKHHNTSYCDVPLARGE